MTVDVSRLQFYSGYPIDKIVNTGTYTVTNPGYFSSSGLQGNITDTTIANSFGKQAFIRYVWSIDGVNFNSPDTSLIYTFTQTPPSPNPPQQQGAYKATTAASVSIANIEFQTFNDYHSNVTINSSNVFSYTAYLLTFTFKYAIYSIL